VTAFDIVVVAVVLFSGVFAYWRGFVREALSIAAWVLAAVAAYYAFPFAAPIAARFLPKGAVANVATGAVTFLLALIVFHIAAKAISSRVKHSALSPIDRTFGFLFGLARGLILVCVAYMALAWFMPAGESRPRWFAQSRTLPFLEAGAEQLEGFFHARRGKASGRITVEREAEQAIGAFSNPNAGNPNAKTVNDAPAYTPDQKRDLNRLIEQQNAH
jgi:membrane protein required for colicin V production